MKDVNQTANGLLRMALELLDLDGDRWEEYDPIWGAAVDQLILDIKDHLFGGDRNLPKG